MPKPAAPWSTPDLRQRCRAIRDSLAATGMATADELAAYWPGGAENDQKGRGGWIFCFANYVRFLGRQAPGDAASDAAVDAAIARRSAAEPALVRLTSGETRAVHPKSYHALRFLDFLDAGHQAAARLAAEHRALEQREAGRVVQLYPLVESLATRLWAWVLTTEGPGLPFADDAVEVDPPAWTRTLTVTDLLALAAAHRKVNHEDVAIIALAFPSDPRESRLSLSGFLNSYAQEAGYRPLDVFRRFSVGEVFAQAVVVAQAAREARAQAESRAERRTA